MDLVCNNNKCQYKWKPYKENPQTCPKCRSRKWSKKPLNILKYTNLSIISIIYKSKTGLTQKQIQTKLMEHYQSEMSKKMRPLIENKILIRKSKKYFINENEIFSLYKEFIDKKYEEYKTTLKNAIQLSNDFDGVQNKENELNYLYFFDINTLDFETKKLIVKDILEIIANESLYLDIHRNKIRINNNRFSDITFEKAFINFNLGFINVFNNSLLYHSNNKKKLNLNNKINSDLYNLLTYIKDSVYGIAYLSNIGYELMK